MLSCFFRREEEISLLAPLEERERDKIFKSKDFLEKTKQKIVLTFTPDTIPVFSSQNMVVVAQSLSHVWLFMTPWTAAPQASLSTTNTQSLLKLMSIELVMTSNQLILCCPLLLPPSIFPSIRVFSNESALPIRWPKYWSFSFSIQPSNEYSALISLRIDWLDLLAVQGTLKSLLQHHSSKASILLHSAFLWSNSHIHTWAWGLSKCLIRQIHAIRGHSPTDNAYYGWNTKISDFKVKNYSSSWVFCLLERSHCSHQAKHRKSLLTFLLLLHLAAHQAIGFYSIDSLQICPHSCIPTVTAFLQGLSSGAR